ncbi:MAG: BMC domain-containing protein [Clostridia bacterium]|nr:BMC domain-containing protein [Clostridia bacterium]
MKALGMIEVYSFSTAVAAADAAAKAADVAVIAFDRNRPISPDVPAPLVMEIKLEGNVSAVKAAVEAASDFAKSEGKYIVSHIIANPAEDTEKMAYLLDINRDKYNKKLPKTMKGAVPAPSSGEAIGLVEIQGLVAAVEGLDTMLKTAEVRLVHTEKRLGGRLVTMVIAGSVSAVSAAVESAVAAASPLGKVYGEEVIPGPHEEVLKFFDMEG